jgi:hypothetical protein
MVWFSNRIFAPYLRGIHARGRVANAKRECRVRIRPTTTARCCGRRMGRRRQRRRAHVGDDLPTDARDARRERALLLELAVGRGLQRRALLLAARVGVFRGQLHLRGPDGQKESTMGMKNRGLRRAFSAFWH